MNNGKVRIYELSRELNLENKDILAICDQLNISVKSHSSTITESEAQAIRAAAEKPANRPVAATKRSVNVTAGERKPNLPSPPNNRNREQHKQQILEIKHQSGAGLGSNIKQRVQVATPPQPPNKQPTASPMKPTTLNRPVRPGQQDAELTPTASEVPELQEAEVSTTTEAVAETPAIATEPTVSRPPAVAEPPARPLQDIAAIVQPVKPILKRAKVETPVAAAKVSQPSVNKPPAINKPTAKTESGEAAPSRSSAPLPELQRPQRKVVRGPVKEPQRLELVKTGSRPTRSGEGAATGTRSEEDEVPGLNRKPEKPAPVDLELKRPTPPRPPKPRSKGWEEEEEEESLNRKGAGKVKRRQTILDEDDDLEDDLAELSETVVVSLSVARPPKPKAPRAAQPATVTAAVGRQTKKATTKSEREAAAAARENSKRRDQKAAPERPEVVTLTSGTNVRELAVVFMVPETEIIKKLFFKGLAVNITQTLDIPTATLVAEEFGIKVETAQETAAATKITEMIDVGDLESLQRRPPVVTIMGHVDHGKTTLLDSIRKTKVAQGEAGGITQHIGAYHVDVVHDGKTQQVVFLDTPGHEAFTAMRARGARVTDIAILVVAADDGVQPQTIEAISHAKAAEVPIVVAINKIDKPDAQPERVKQELTEFGLVSEEWGGDTIMVPVSAIKGENLDTLLEMILLVAEVGELSANPNRPAKGTVIEANLDKSRGSVATLLVQNGTLRVGDTLVAGSVFGKVRAMIDDRGHRVSAATPSFAVEVLGLSDVPEAGDDFEVFTSEKEARAIASTRSDEQRQSRLQQVMASRRVTLNSLSAQAQEGELKELNLILKADVQGSVEAILGSLKQLPQNEVQIRVLLAAPGEVTETDVDLAAASGAVIVGFNTTLATGARQAADQASVDVREYNIIYKMLDDIEGAMEGLLEPEMVEEPLGQVEVRAVFPVGRSSVAGCYVLSGKVVRNCRVRVRRSSKVVYEGVLDSLKRLKEDAKEVNAGFECGIGVDKFKDWTEGDIIEAYQMVSKRRTLSPN